MCLVRVKEEEEVRIPVRVSSRRRTSTSRRVSRAEIYRDSYRDSLPSVRRETIIRETRPQSSTYIAIPAPAPMPIPAPQPVPIFVEPPPPPPAPPTVISTHSHHTHRGAHYVEVSPSRRSSTSSESSAGTYELHQHEREYRRERRAYSPDSPRHDTFRYVEGPQSESDYGERYVRRERSRSRGPRYEDPRGSYRETHERVTIGVDDGRRRSDYRR
ncbi:hypothetical protein P154DRAFT_528161 [Amniculicola lignicola CBS 123094]|uniref:Uncharacterized protein n=1 Tax=Amniculicola lignicola CBS 123094 TaxID=1392246 RepID=A0A6A5W126_9PLEO|nr:hypothetical protein P154DRAFT_528161 [Amniculicola lignicola CBS 123094]